MWWLCRYVPPFSAKTCVQCPPNEFSRVYNMGKYTLHLGGDHGDQYDFSSTLFSQPLFLGSEEKQLQNLQPHQPLGVGVQPFFGIFRPVIGRHLKSITRRESGKRYPP